MIFLWSFADRTHLVPRSTGWETRQLPEKRPCEIKSWRWRRRRAGEKVSWGSFTRASTRWAFPLKCTQANWVPTVWTAVALPNSSSMMLTHTFHSAGRETVWGTSERPAAQPGAIREPQKEHPELCWLSQKLLHNNVSWRTASNVSSFIIFSLMLINFCVRVLWRACVSELVKGVRGFSFFVHNYLLYWPSVWSSCWFATIERSFSLYILPCTLNIKLMSDDFYIDLCTGLSWICCLCNKLKM